MNLSILNIKKSQLKNASQDASVSTIEAPVQKQKPDYTGVPEAEAQAEAIKEQKKTATTKARAERKASAKKTAKAEPKPIKPKAEVTEAVKPKPIKGTDKPKAKKEKEPTKKTTPKFTVVDYSEKCIALFGDTKPIKDELKKLGGRFNANLRPFDDDTRVPGWVFPKKCKDDLMKLIK